MIVRSADRNATEDERTGAISSWGMALRIVGIRDGVGVLKFAFSDLKLRKDGTDRCGRGRFRSSREGARSEALNHLHLWPAFLPAGFRNVAEP
jgi:hypothetical protein